jgi:cytochrome oxidase Cu insertion factor (SCO1/SenC/PrrC family)
LAALAFAVIAVVVLWTLPKLVPPTGTLIVVAAGRSATTLPQTTLSVHETGGSWATAGNVSGDVPAAPDQRQLLVVQMRAGSYDQVRAGAVTERVLLTITAGQVAPLLLGIDGDKLAIGAVYAGNDDVNLGLGELSGKFVPLPAFELFDQHGQPVNLATIQGKDVVIGAFHTNCHETCPLYTALFLQLAKHLPPGVMLLEVTTDTADTPSVLEKYAQQVGASWTFGTGTDAGIAGFWRLFGVEISSGDVHTSTLALVDRHGYVRLVYRGVPKVGHDIPPDLVTSLSARGLAELGSGGDGWSEADVLDAVTTITGSETRVKSGGGKAAPFTLTSTDGSLVTLSDLSGKPLVINFWATYCPPCKAEMPMLEQQVGAQPGVRLVLVNEGESRTAARAFLDDLGIKQAALLDSDTSVLRSYGLFALPTTIFVRADGTIDRRYVGQLDAAVLQAELSAVSTQ